MYTRPKTNSELTAMKTSGRLLATVLATLREAVEGGMSSKDLAEIAKRELRGTGGQPTFLGYYGFPDVLCVSVNDQVVHGIPSKQQIIQTGDVVSLDFGVTYDGMITDSAVTVIVDGVNNERLTQLVEATEQALAAGVKAAKVGGRVGDISHAVAQRLQKGNYGIVRSLVGHGVGHQLHEDPNIPNYGQAGTGDKLFAGMTIAIEPMATLGGHQVKTAADGWTVSTVDGSWAAHFEHTILVTPTGGQILTAL